MSKETTKKGVQVTNERLVHELASAAQKQELAGWWCDLLDEAARRLRGLEEARTDIAYAANELRDLPYVAHHMTTEEVLQRAEDMGREIEEALGHITGGKGPGGARE